MKRVLFFAVLWLVISYTDFAQCPYPVTLVSSNGACVGTTLTVSTTHALSQIVWYQGNTAVQTVTGTRAAGGVVMATGGLENPFTDEGTMGLFVDDSGNIFLTSAVASSVFEWSPTARKWVVAAGGNGFGAAANQLSSLTAVYVDKQGNMYLADEANSRIQKWAPGAVGGVTVAGGNGQGSAANQLNGPVAVYVDCGGNIYIADSRNNRVQRWAAGASSGVTVAGANGQGSAANQLSTPNSVWQDGSGNVYVLDGDNNRVQKWAPGAGSGITVAGGNGGGPDANQLNRAKGLYVDHDGNVYIADLGNLRIQQWAPGATTGTTILSSQQSAPASGCFNVFIDNTGTLFGSSTADNQLVKVPLTVSIDNTFKPVAGGSYYAVVTDVNGFSSSTDTLHVYEPVTGPSSIQISASATNINVCTPVTFTATVSNGGTGPSYQWQVSGVNVGADSPVYANNIFANGDRVVCILTTAGSGCTISKDTSNAVTLSVDPQGHATVSITASDTAVCAGTPVNFTATVTNGASTPVFQWLVNGVVTGGSSSEFSSSSLANGDVVYCLITSDASCGLAKSNSIPISVYPLPVIAPGQVFHIPYGQSLELEPVITGDIASYLWTPGTGLSGTTIRNPVADPAASTSYTLQVVSPGGCQASGTILVDVYTPLSIPSAFTPNGDGRNDILYVLGGPAGSQIREFAVFNRWGAAVFQVHNGAPGDPRYGWDGMIRGRPAPPDAYVYMVELSLAGGGRQVYKGSVMLIR
jgi:gliding motility-associated-like protein